MNIISNFIDKYDNFLVFGHEDPDADSICSQLAIARYIRSIGKSAHVYSQLPFKRTELKQFETDCEPEILDGDITSNSAVILVDHNNIKRTAPFSEKAADLPLAIIDHHDTSSQPVPEKYASYIDSSAASTTAVIYKFLKFKDFKFDPDTAEILLLGLATDTGFFRHLEEHSGEALRIAAALTDLGASPNKVFYEVYGCRSVSSRKFLGIMLSRMQTFFDGQLLIVYETLADLKTYSPIDRDKDMLYQILLGTKGAKIIASFMENDAKKCSAGLRSTGNIDVAKIASEFGGGGHKKASGYTAYTTIEDAISQFVNYIEDFFKTSDQENAN